jgi:hypothetical protein
MESLTQLNLNWIEEYENTNLFQVILNILLVYQDTRKATLIEWNNFTKEERETYEPMGKNLFKNWDSIYFLIL